MKAMLFCAGLGTRLRPMTDHLPKALVPVNGKTLLQRNIEYLDRFGIQEIVINVHYFSEKIIQYLEQNGYFDKRIIISDESDEILETGGALRKAAHHFEDQTFVVMNVDILTTLALDKLINFHQQHNPLVTLAVTDRESSRKLLFNMQHHLCGWQNMLTDEQAISRESENYRYLAFSGIHVVSPEFLPMITRSDKHSIIDPYLKAAQNHIIVGYDHTGDYLIDVGKPETLQKAETFFV